VHKISLQSIDTTIPLPAMGVQMMARTITTHRSNRMPQRNEASVHIETKAFVMIIDDSVTVRKIIETCLGREGFDVLSFRDGLEAIRWMTSPPGRIPDLILLDIFLPTVNGYEIAKYVQSQPQFCNIVIVIISRHDGVLDRLKGRLVGAKAYLSKPFTTQQILSVMELCLCTKRTIAKEMEEKPKNRENQRCF
jgi:twitching motility two-component system response regulator PilG